MCVVCSKQAKEVGEGVGMSNASAVTPETWKT